MAFGQGGLGFFYLNLINLNLAEKKEAKNKNSTLCKKKNNFKQPNPSRKRCNMELETPQSAEKQHKNAWPSARGVEFLLFKLN